MTTIKESLEAICAVILFGALLGCFAASLLAPVFLVAKFIFQ